DPMLFSAFHNFFRRLSAACCFAHLAFGKQYGLFATEAGNNLSLIADEHHAFARKCIVTHLNGRVGLHASVVPKEIESRERLLGGESEVNDAGVRERDVVTKRAADITFDATGGGT